MIGALALTLMQGAIVFAAATPTFSQTINAGTLSVDIVDGSAVSVTSPSVTFAGLTFSFDSQTGTGTLGTASAKIRASNPTSTATWSVTLAATSGTSSVWTASGNTYDYNDVNGTSSDDSSGFDSDAVTGRLTVDPYTSGTVTGIAGTTTCSVAAIGIGSSSSFTGSSTSANITIMTAGASAQTFCRYDYTGAALSQSIPASQASGTYTLGFTLSIS
jgi:hypothetical protein